MTALTITPRSLVTPEWFLRVARTLPAPLFDAPITASFNRRARDGFWHYAHVWLRSWRYPRYRNHRPVRIFHEWAGWIWRLIWQKRWERRTHEVGAALAGTEHFLFPLQLTSDYQSRQPLPFPDMESATNYVLASFARSALAHAHLLLKIHPLDVSMIPWRRRVRGWARNLGLTNRVHIVDGGSLEDMIEAARGMVCVNSTSATLALSRDTSVAAIGDAVYNMPRLTHQDSLDNFWSAPEPPEGEVFDAFRAALVDRCLVRGGVASASAVAALIDAIVARLLSGWEPPAVLRERHRPV